MTGPNNNHAEAYRLQPHSNFNLTAQPYRVGFASRSRASGCKPISTGFKEDWKTETDAVAARGNAALEIISADAALHIRSRRFTP
jgi:hypothetical protein